MTRHGIFVLLLISALSLMGADTTPPVLSYVAERDHGRGLEMEGALQVTPEGYLHFDGSLCAAIFPDSAKYNITKRGYGVLMTCRIPAELADEALFSLVNKLFCFRSNRFRKGGLYVTFTPGDKKSGDMDEGAEITLRGGRALPRGEWMHFAITAEYLDEPEQGRVGYTFRYYINGELIAEKTALGFEPFQSPQPIAIGLSNNGSGSYRGDVAAVEIYDRFVPESEIAEKIVADSRLKLYMPAGYVQGTADIAELAGKLRLKVAEQYQSWLVTALERAERMEGNTQSIAAVLQAVEKISATDKSIETFAQAFNQAQSEFRLTVNSQMALLTVSKGGATNPPIIDIFDRTSQHGLLAGRSFGWRLKVGKQEIFDHTHGISYSVHDFSVVGNECSFTVLWQLDGLAVTGKFHLQGNRLGATLSATSPDAPITEYTFPKLVLNHLKGKQDTAVLPFRSGTLYPEFSKGGSLDGVYPNADITMPFMGYYDEQGNGIYVAWEDPSCCRKEVRFSGKQGQVEVSYTSSVGIKDSNLGNYFAMPGEAVLECYQGDWFSAGQIYKRFLQTKSDWYPQHPRLDTPEWFRNTPLIILMARNKNAFPYLRDYFELPFVINCSNPPGSMDMLRQHDVRLKTYTNIRLWKYFPPISDKSPKEQYDLYKGYQDSPEAKANAILLEDGSILQETFSNFPWTVGCPSAEGWQEQLRQTVTKFASQPELWSAIYHDQLDSTSKLCYSSSHGHLIGDPCAWIRGYRQFLTWFASQRKLYPELSHDGEDFSEAYARWTDGFMAWRFVQTNQVPLVQSLYAGGRVQFTGRSFGGGEDLNNEAWLCKIASQLVYGEQLGWFPVSDILKASPRRVFVKKLCHLRYELLGYFNDSDMLPPLHFQETMPMMHTRWGDLSNAAQAVETPQVLHSVWQRSDGNCLAIFVNTANSAITLHPDLTLSGTLRVCREGSDKFDVCKTSQAPELTLPPYACEVWFIGDDTATPEVLARKMAQFPGYDSGQDVE